MGKELSNQDIIFRLNEAAQLVKKIRRQHHIFVSIDICENHFRIVADTLKDTDCIARDLQYEDFFVERTYNPLIEIINRCIKELDIE